MWKYPLLFLLQNGILCLEIRKSILISNYLHVVFVLHFLIIVIIISDLCRPSQFYLVLDVCNVTQHEMEIHYAKTKQILVEKGDTCRIPVPLDRCSLTNVEKGTYCGTQNYLLELYISK